MTTPVELDALIEEVTVDAYGDEAQLSGFLVGAQEALFPAESATIVGVGVNVLPVDCGPDVRTGLTARVRRDGATFEVALADLAAYRRWQGR